MKDLINWKQLSLILSNSDNTIRKNWYSAKYKKKIDTLLTLLEGWKAWAESDSDDLDGLISKEESKRHYKEGYKEGYEEALNDVLNHLKKKQNEG